MRKTVLLYGYGILPIQIFNGRREAETKGTNIIKAVSPDDAKKELNHDARRSDVLIQDTKEIREQNMERSMNSMSQSRSLAGVLITPYLNPNC
jgi:hypothetical protein